MKITKFFSTIVALLIAAMSVGFTSCNKDNKEPEMLSLPGSVMGDWYENYLTLEESGGYRYVYEYRFGFKTDGTYSYVTPNESINGLYRLIEIINETTVDFTFINGEGVEVIATYDASLYKMLVSESSDFDQVWVYHHSEQNYSRLIVDLYSNNELVQKCGPYRRYNSP